MDLFDCLINPSENLLPNNGTVNYFGVIMSPERADNYLSTLLKNIEWKHDKAVIMGKHIKIKRKVAWYGERPFEYTYSNIKRYALPWTEALLELKNLVEQQTKETFNSCLLNLYHSGSEGVSWHSDAEKDLKENGAIASLSFGADRKFSFKNKKTKETISVVLQHGSILVMKGVTQKHWLHQLPQSKKITEPRINLTFRTITTNIR